MSNKFKPSIFNSANYDLKPGKRYNTTLGRCKNCNKFFNWYKVAHLIERKYWFCPHCGQNLMDINDLSLRQ